MNSTPVFSKINQQSSREKLYKKIEQKALELRLFERTTWQRLLRYKKGTGNSFESEADGLGFFVDPIKGKSDPKAELQATLKALVQGHAQGLPGSSLNDDRSQVDEKKKSDPSLAYQTLPVGCRFPARSAWLMEQLPSLKEHVLDFSCPRLEEFRKTYGPKRISLVFSSAYLESPASAFGHTLLRLHKGVHKTTGEHHELLDVGVNFSADVTTNNALLYAVYGLFGIFRGRFSALPYYYKVREYNDFESRDLWSYELALSQKQIHFFMDHLWELAQTYFDYYYFSENCSYHLLAAIEVLNENWNFLDQLDPYVIPIDTVKVLTSTPGLVTNIQLRPSRKRMFEASYKTLKSDEKKFIPGLVLEEEKDKSLYSKSQLLSLNQDNQAKIVDTALDFMDYAFAEDVLREQGEGHEKKQVLLASRSTLPVLESIQESSQEKVSSPDLSPKAKRLTLSSGQGDERGPFQSLEMRFALHDSLDPLSGRSLFSHIEMGKVKVQYEKRRNKILIQDLTAIDMSSLRPWHPLIQKTSFQGRFGVKRYSPDDYFFLQEESLSPFFEMAAGFTLSPSVKWKSSLFFKTELAFESEFTRRNTLLGLGPLIQIDYFPSENLLTRTQLQALQYVTQGNEQIIQGNFELRWYIQKNWGPRLILNQTRSASQAELGAMIFF